MNDRRGITLESANDELCTLYDAVLLDLDGVVYVGPDAVPGAAEALSRVAKSAALAYLTNNASRTPESVAAHLRDLGMPVAADHSVVTSAQAVAGLMARELPHGSAVLTVGGEGLRIALQSEGFVPVESIEEGPVAAVQGYGALVSWAQLAEISFAVQAGLPWYASNEDLTIPTRRGIAPGNGSLVQAVKNATGAAPIVAGKPSRPLFDETLRRIGAQRPVMVGDRLDTDIDGAIAANIDSLAVLSGVGTVRQWFAAPPGHRPSFVAADVAGLGQVHLPVEIGSDSAQCGDARVTVRDRRVVAESRPDEVGTLRAAVGLAWAHADSYYTTLVPDGTLDL